MAGAQSLGNSANASKRPAADARRFKSSGGARATTAISSAVFTSRRVCNRFKLVFIRTPRWCEQNDGVSAPPRHTGRRALDAGVYALTFGVKWIFRG